MSLRRGVNFDTFIKKRHDYKNFVKNHTATFFFFRTRYFGDPLFEYKKSNSHVYIYLSSIAGFSKKLHTKYAIQSWKLAFFIT